VLWCALYGTRRQLSAVIAEVAAIFVVPRVLVGAPRYPVTEWERAIIWPLTGLVVGLTVQELVSRIKHQAEQLKELAGTDALPGRAKRTWDDSLAPRARARKTKQRALGARTG
jgi:hypothetical protein